MTPRAKTKTQKLISAKNLKHLLILIPKCIELNSESEPKLILVLGLALGIIQDRDLIAFFWRDVWLQLVIGIRIRLIGKTITITFYNDIQKIQMYTKYNFISKTKYRIFLKFKLC